MAEKESRTEQPTGKRLSEAHDRGQFAKSPELQVLCTMAAALGILAFTEQAAVERTTAYAISIFTNFGHMRLTQETVPGDMITFFLTVGPIAVPVLLATAAASLLIGGFQSGFKLTPKALELKWDRLNFAAGFSRVFSNRISVYAGLDVLKLFAIGGALFLGARGLMRDSLFSSPVEVGYLGGFLYKTAVAFFSRLLLALGILAAISFAWERFRTNRDLMMSRAEVQDEQKQMEMDAKVKAALRRLGRRLLLKQMLEAVPTADVIVTNPTHFAVALKYERGKDEAPIVLAKGDGRFAQRIKQIGAEHEVPTVENKPVARLLYAMGKVGEPIPSELYKAVAEILAMVYRTNRYYFHRLRARRLEQPA